MWMKNGMLLDDRFQFIRSDLTTENSIISAIGTCNGNEMLDCSDCYVVPGFIDTHIHGAQGKSFLDFDENTYKTIAKYEAEHGTTGLVATLSAATEEKLLSAVENVVACTKNPLEDCAFLHGIHLEGPFFAERYKGAHLPENIRKPNMAEITRLLQRADGRLKILTIAPELPGADDIIHLLVKNDVCVSAGHTDASCKEMYHGLQNGITQATHLFNAMRPLSHREPGAVGALLSDSTVKCEIICDFVHVHPLVVKLAMTAKGIDKINLITDAEIAAGMAEGTYSLNGRTLTVKESRIYTEDGSLAGGYTCLLDCVKNLVSIGIPLKDACRMASKNPAETLGIYDSVGSLTVGKKADLLVLTQDLELKHVILRGKRLF